MDGTPCEGLRGGVGRPRAVGSGAEISTARPAAESKPGAPLPRLPARPPLRIAKHRVQRLHGPLDAIEVFALEASESGGEVLHATPAALTEHRASLRRRLDA